MRILNNLYKCPQINKRYQGNKKNQTTSYWRYQKSANEITTRTVLEFQWWIQIRKIRSSKDKYLNAVNKYY